MKELRIPFVAVCAGILQFASAAIADITVPGYGNPWLAGQPDGTGASGDSAPAQSPAFVTLVDFAEGDELSFTVSGSVNYGGGVPTTPPDGDLGGFRSLFHLFDSTNGGPENGIAGLNAPANSLVGVFLTASQPAPGPTAAPFFNFAPDGNVSGNVDYTSIAPAIAQPFFIGDGRTASGAEQRVRVPSGATRLFLGSMDGSGWYNNSGAFHVRIGLAGTVPVEAVVNQHFSFRVGVPAGSFAEGTIVTYNTTSLPQGFVIDPKTGEITGVARAGSETARPILVQVSVSDGTKTVMVTLALTISDGVPFFTVNDSDKPSYPGAAATPVPGLADKPLAFAAKQAGALEGRVMSVQATTTPGNAASWQNLPTATNGFMVYDFAGQQYVLNTTNYPAQNGVYFRARLKAPSYPDAVSNVVGPFDLASATQRLGTTALYIKSNGLAANIRFGVTQTPAPSGVGVRIQATTTPATEGSWADISGGGMTADPAAPSEFYLGLDEYPSGDGVYFRAVASASGFVDNLSGPQGPFTFIRDPAATVSITIGNGGSGGEDFDFPIQVNPGSFNVTANAQNQSNRPFNSIDLIYDGDTLEHFGARATTGTTQYNTNVMGDHLIEAAAIDDLGVIGYAPPVHVRVAPPAPGRLFYVTTTGNWSDENIWIDAQGNHGVPGANDFAVLSDVNVTLTGDVTVGAFSLNGGTIDGAHRLTVARWCTLGAGRIKSDFYIDDGATLLLINDTDVGIGGQFTNAGRLKLHGKGGITGIANGTSKMLRADGSTSPDGFFDGIVGFFKNIGQAIFHPPAGGRKGSVKSSPPPPAVTAPEVRTITVGSVLNSGKIVAQGGGNIVAQGGGNIVAQGGGNLITNDGGSLVDKNGNKIVAQGGGNIVAQGGGNIVAQGGGNIVAQGGGNIISTNGGGLVAQGGGNLVATGGPNIVAQGGGNLVAQGGGNIVAQGGGNLISSNAVAIVAQGGGNLAPRMTAEASSAAGFSQNGGEIDLTQITLIGSVALDGGILSGNGTVVGDLTNNSGFILPGHSPGELGVTGSFSQAGSGTLVIEASGGSAGLFDMVQVGGEAALGGRLDVRTIAGYVPLADDPFSPMGYGSVSGSFSSVSGNLQLSFGSGGASTTLVPNAPNPSSGQPLNIATRMSVQTGDNALIAGFIVTGPAGSSKKVLIRGLGPSLAQFGVAGTLSDPLLELHDGSVVTINDNWQQGDTSQIPNGFAPSDSREAVIVATLSPGNYSAVVKGAHGETGVGIAELYDLDAASPAKLANISTRGFINTGDDVMIGGFIVGGNEPAKILVRAIGPTLTDFGVQGALADPTLELHDSNGMTIANDNWRETQESEIIATTIPPNKDREPAILATLVPGNYTAVVRGKNNTTGVGLVEAYNLP